MNTTVTSNEVIDYTKLVITPSDIQLAIANGDTGLLNEVARRAALENPSEPASMKEHLVAVASTVVKPAMFAANLTGSVVGVVGQKLDDRRSIRASLKAYRQSVIIPEGRALRDAFEASKAAKKGGETES